MRGFGGFWQGCWARGGLKIEVLEGMAGSAEILPIRVFGWAGGAGRGLADRFLVRVEGFTDVLWVEVFAEVAGPVEVWRVGVSVESKRRRRSGGSWVRRWF